MAAIIYEKSNGSLVATGNRRVTTFESGLVRVDRVYVCATTNAAAHRLTLMMGGELPDDDGAPAIDGLFIFPAPQETTRGDGFTEFAVSAYGRVSSAPKTDASSVITLLGYYGRIFYSLNIITGEVPLPRGNEFNAVDIQVDPAIFDPFGFVCVDPDLTVTGYALKRTITENRVNWDGSVIPAQTRILEIYIDGGISPSSDIVIVTTPIIEITSRRAFGSVDELTFSASPAVADTSLYDNIVSGGFAG